MSENDNTTRTWQERSIIDAILGKNSVFYGLGLTADHFHDPDHREAFKAIKRIIDSGREADLITLAEELSPGRAVKYEAWGGANVDYYVRQLKERRIKEQLVAVAKDMVRDMKNRSVNTIVDRSLTQIIQVTKQSEVLLHRSSEHVHEMIEETEARYHDQSATVGYQTGFDGLDSILDGLIPTELNIIAARTSVGKTALALNMALNMARRGISVAVFSCEMSHKELMRRFASTLSGLNHGNIRKGALSEKDFSILTEAAGKLYDMPLWICDKPNIPFDELRNQARAFVARGGQVVIVDYLTLVKYGDPKMPRFERVGMLSAELKDMARMLDVPVVALSQLNRGAEDRPTMANIRQSGEIEENADVIMILQRIRERSEAVLQVVKHRNGPTGKVNLFFDPGTLTFTETLEAW